MQKKTNFHAGILLLFYSIGRIRLHSKPLNEGAAKMIACLTNLRQHLESYLKSIIKKDGVAKKLLDAVTVTIKSYKIEPISYADIPYIEPAPSYTVTPRAGEISVQFGKKPQALAPPLYKHPISP